MPVEELAAGLFSIIGRFIGYLFIEVALEILVKGVGYLIVKAMPYARTKEIDPDCFLVMFFGFVFWCLVAVLVYWLLTGTGSV